MANNPYTNNVRVPKPTPFGAPNNTKLNEEYGQNEPLAYGPRPFAKMKAPSTQPNEGAQRDAAKKAQAKDPDPDDASAIIDLLTKVPSVARLAAVEKELVEAKSKIYLAVLGNELSSGILYEALMAWASWRSPRASWPVSGPSLSSNDPRVGCWWTEDDVSHFLNRYQHLFRESYVRTRGPSVNPSELIDLSEVRLEDTQDIIKFHRIVEFFARRLCYILQKNPLTGKENPSTMSCDPSETELLRIQRAFYRFQVYCNLFGRRQTCKQFYRYQNLQRKFLDLFAPWEIEQLRTIHDILILWLKDANGYKMALGGLDPKKDQITIDVYNDNYLSLGLEWLERVVKIAPDFFGVFLQQQKMLKNEKHQSGYYLGTALSTKVIDKTMSSICHNENHGPQVAWAKLGNVRNDNLSEDERAEDLSKKRSWAYCFWDKARLIRWRALPEDIKEKGENYRDSNFSSQQFKFGAGRNCFEFKKDWI